MPKILRSSSTFSLGNFGGHGGRASRSEDVLRVNMDNVPNELIELPNTFKPKMNNVWTIGVIPGPNCSEEFLKPDYLEQLTQTEWQVHFNSSRTGVRLIGPAPH